MPKLVAKILSAVLHPMLMPTYGILLMFAFPTYMQTLSFELKKALVMIVFLSTFVAPLFAFLVLVNLRIIKNIELRDRKERLYPYLIALLFYTATFIILYRIPTNIPLFVYVFIFLSILGIVLISIVNFWFKISAHTSALTGLVAFMSFFLYQFNIESVGFIIPAFLIIGVLASARLQLNAHSPKEIYTGIIAGLLTGSLPFWLFLISFPNV